jgi:hypothetical protein
MPELIRQVQKIQQAKIQNSIDKGVAIDLSNHTVHINTNAKTSKTLHFKGTKPN